MKCEKFLPRTQNFRHKIEGSGGGGGLADRIANLVKGEGMWMVNRTHIPKARAPVLIGIFPSLDVQGPYAERTDL